MGIRSGLRTGKGRLHCFETILITWYLIKSNSSEIMSVKLATYILIRGRISKEAQGVRCWTAPGLLENPRSVWLMLAQCSNMLGLTPHCLAPEVNGVKHKCKVGVKFFLLQSTGLKCPFLLWWE